MSVTAETSEVHESDAFSVLGEALESAAETFGDMTASARDTARAAARNVSHTVSTGVYKGSYGVSFGVVFSAVFLTELLPERNALRRGLEDGAGAAIDAMAHRRAKALIPADAAPAHDEFATPQSLPAPELSAVPGPTGRRRARAVE